MKPGSRLLLGLDYGALVEDREAFRQYLNEQIVAHPELFPEGIESGYRFHGWVESSDAVGEIFIHLSGLRFQRGKV